MWLLVAMMAGPSRPAFWTAGGFVGLIFGGISTAERPLLLSLVPESEAARFFSLMLLSARAAAVAGPLIWGITLGSLGPVRGTALAYRAAVSTVACPFFASSFLLPHVSYSPPD